MRLTRRLKHVVDTLFPAMTLARRASRSRRGSHREARERGYVALDRRLADAIGTRVASGPFAGMVLTAEAFREHVGPALLGIYEAELHPAIERLMRHRYPQVVDVGAKYGYYAVGFSLRQPHAAGVTFDVDPWARRATREVARANGLRRLRVLGLATPAWFDRHLMPGALVMSDCEGFERELFPAITTSAADTTTFLVEVHETMAPGATERLQRRFAATHALEWIPVDPAPVLPAELRARLAGFSAEEITMLTDELRGGRQEWLVAVPREG